MTVNGTASFIFKHSIRGGPIRWLILGGAFLIAAITISTTIIAGNFRERALNSSERELENTVLLLARHFRSTARRLRGHSKGPHCVYAIERDRLARGLQAADVRPGYPSDAQGQARRIVVCRRRQHFRCGRSADQRIRIMACTGSPRRGSVLFQGVQV